MELTEDQKIAFSFALKDIKNGHETLFTNQLKKEYPELYKYAVEKAQEV